MLLKKWSVFCMAALLSAFLCSCSDSSSGSADDPEENEEGGGNGKDNPSDSTDANGAYVMITEIMYNAPENSSLEWVELKIVGGSAMQHMDQYALRLEGAVSYEFPDEPLDTNEYIVVTNDPELFRKTYKDFKGRLFGPWGKDVKTDSLAKLSNEGDVIDVKLDGKGDVSCAFSKEPPWPSLADGNGSSLVFVGGNPTQATSWAASKKTWGNPGAADEYVEPITVRLNEIQPYNVTAGENGWVELYNFGNKEVDVTGWIFESKYKKASWTIKKGKVPAKGYLVLATDDASVFGEQIYLSHRGGSYYLYETLNGKKTGGESSLLLAASYQSSGVVDISDGSTAQGAMSKATKGAANKPLKVGPLFIDEIYYHPYEGSVPFEFMEIVNKADTAVNLYVTNAGKSKGWKVEGINMEFSSGDIVPAGGRVLLISDSLNADSVRADYNIASDVLICHYKGKLSNRGETIAVKKPLEYDEITPSETDPSMNTLVQWYYDWSDATLYSDSWEGLEDADGYGKSLQRVDYNTMGYEASAWKVTKPTIGK